MEDGELNSLIEGLSQHGSNSGQLLLTQQNHYVVSNTYISADPPFPTPSPSPRPQRPSTPTAYSAITQNSNPLVQLFHNQGNSIVGRTQLIQANAVQTSVQSTALKGKQPQQILPKPLPSSQSSAANSKRITPTLSQQPAPLIINQAQPNPTLLLNQMLTSGGPMLVQPAGGGGTVHLMLRPPGPTVATGPGSHQNKMVLGNSSPQQTPTVLIQQNRQQVMRIMTAQGPMQVQLQQIQTPTGPQIIAIPTNHPGLSFPTNSVLVQGIQPMQQLQPMPQQQQQQQQQQALSAAPQPLKPKKPTPVQAQKRSKVVRSRSDSSASSPPTSPSLSSPKVSVMSSPLSSPSAVHNVPAQTQKNVTSTLRQVRPTAFARKQPNESKDVAKNEEASQSKGPPLIDNLTATINSVAENVKSPARDDAHPLGDVLSGTQNLNLNKRPNLTIFQKNKPGAVSSSSSSSSSSEPVKKTTPTKKKNKKDENKMDLWELMKSAGIGDEEFEEAGPSEIPAENVEISADSELLAQLQNSQTLQIPPGLRLAVGEDGRPVIIDGSNVLIPDVGSHGTQTHSGEVLSTNESSAMLNLTPQALATAQNQLTQLLQDHGTITAADQQLLTQIFTVNPAQGLGGVPHTGVAQASNVQQQQQLQQQPAAVENVVMSSRSTETTPHAPAEPATTHQTAHEKSEPAPEFVGGLPPGLRTDSLVITNNNGVPTLVASPAVMQFLQTHRAIIQFHQDPVTKAMQSSLIIPHNSQNPPQEHGIVTGNKSPRSHIVLAKDNAPTLGSKINAIDVDGLSLGNIVRNQSLPSNVKISMARMIQDNPNLLQIARDTNNLISYKESCSTLTDTELADLDRKITNNRTLLDQSFHMEMDKSGSKDSVVLQVAGTQTLSDLQALGAVNAANSDFQNKFLESIGMANSVPTVVHTPAKAAAVVVAAPPKKSRKKKADKAAEAVQPAGGKKPPVGNLTFNIKQLTPEQNERLNAALNQRGVTANRVAMGEMTDLEKQIIEEEIRRVTGGTLGNTTVKFFPPPTSITEDKPSATTQVSSVRYYAEDDGDLNSSAIVLNNPNLNQLLENPVGGQLLSVGNQVLQLSSTPPPGSVIVGSNGQVMGFVQHAPTLQLTQQKQQMLKSVQMQMQAIQAKGTRTAADQAALEKLAGEQQKIIQSGKLITGTHSNQSIQIVSPAVAGMPQRVIQTKLTSGAGSQSVSCGTSTADMPTNVGSKQTPLPLLLADSPGQYGPLYVSPNTAGKNVTKCEKGTSPIQIQMGTQTMQAVELRSGKMSTGTMTSPNTGKPQAVVAPAIVHSQLSDANQAHANSNNSIIINNQLVKQRRCASPVLTLSKTALIEKQMATDEMGAARPDVHTPFLSKSDAVKRLIRYHTMDEKGLSVQDLHAADDMFEATAHHLLDKFRLMKDKYKFLLLMESMREVSTAERIMVDRNFIIQERYELEELRKEKNPPNDFDSPPPAETHAQPQPPLAQPEPDPDPSIPDLSPPAPAPSQPPAHYEHQAIEKTDLTMQLSDGSLMDLNDSFDSDSDSLSPFKADTDDNDNDGKLQQPESAVINAQVQSAIDSILNLRPSDEPVEKKKRKRHRHGKSDSGKKRSRRRDCEKGTEGNGDPALDEAIRSILAS